MATHQDTPRERGMEFEYAVERHEHDDYSWIGEVKMAGMVIYRNAFIVMCRTEEEAITQLKSSFAYRLSQVIPNDEPSGEIPYV